MSVEFQKNYRIIVEKIFNNWQNLRLAVEHGMGGRNGQKVAIDIMNYAYEFCVGNDNIAQGELQEVIEELMDQEFNTICEDGSINEICKHLLRYKEMSLQGRYAEIELELKKLPEGKEWLKPEVKVVYTAIAGDSSSEDGDFSEDSDKDDFVEPEDGWTTVRNKKK